MPASGIPPFGMPGTIPLDETIALAPETRRADPRVSMMVAIKTGPFTVWSKKCE